MLTSPCRVFQIFTGKQAVACGLVDALGGLDAAVRKVFPMVEGTTLGLCTIQYKCHEQTRPPHLN